MVESWCKIVCAVRPTEARTTTVLPWRRFVLTPTGRPAREQKHRYVISVDNSAAVARRSRRWPFGRRYPPCRQYKRRYSASDRSLTNFELRPRWVCGEKTGLQEAPGRRRPLLIPASRPRIPKTRRPPFAAGRGVVGGSDRCYTRRKSYYSW